MAIDFSTSPIISRIIATLRDVSTKAPEFRTYLQKLGEYIGYEAAKLLPTVEKTVESPLGTATYVDFESHIIITGILRAALPMVEGVFDTFPEASLGLISASRGEMIGTDGSKFNIDATYSKIPKLSNSTLFIVDPMLATASTLLHLLAEIHNRNDQPKRIFILCALATQYGIDRIEQAYPEATVMAATIDPILNDHGYIVPGLGDAGDRAFNT